MVFNADFFKQEIREGFTVTPMMKRAWAVNIEVLSEIDRICKKYDIKYFAYYGTLLGTMRHKGFVPWDDDADIGMLRRDFERFFEVAPSELKHGFVAKGHVAKDMDYDAMASVVSKEALQPKDLHVADEWEVVNDPLHGCPYVMGVDIYPLDYLPDDEDFWNTQRMLHMAAYDAAMRCDELSQSGEIEDLVGQLAELTGIAIDDKKPVQPQLFYITDRLAAMAGESESSHVVWMQKAARTDAYKDMDKRLFDSISYMPFENIELPVMDGYDTVLRTLYGDYSKFVRGNSAHTYPVFKLQDEWLREKIKPEVVVGYIGTEEGRGLFTDICRNVAGVSAVTYEIDEIADSGVITADALIIEKSQEDTGEHNVILSDYKGIVEFIDITGKDISDKVKCLADKVRGREIDRLTGVDDHNSFYYDEKSLI